VALLAIRNHDPLLQPNPTHSVPHDRRRNLKQIQIPVAKRLLQERSSRVSGSITAQQKEKRQNSLQENLKNKHRVAGEIAFLIPRTLQIYQLIGLYVV
jgi:hypothetical protein